MKEAAEWLLLLLTLVGCASFKKATDQQPILRIERTPCFGRCPVYVFEVYENRNVHYHGVKNVAREGTQKIKLSTKEYNTLIEKFEALPFSDYNATYGKNIRDITYIYVTYKGKKIKMTQGSPPKELADQVRNIELQFNLLK